MYVSTTFRRDRYGIYVLGGDHLESKAPPVPETEVELKFPSKISPDHQPRPHVVPALQALTSLCGTSLIVLNTAMLELPALIGPLLPSVPTGSEHELLYVTYGLRMSLV